MFAISLFPTGSVENIITTLVTMIRDNIAVPIAILIFMLTLAFAQTMFNSAKNGKIQIIPTDNGMADKMAKIRADNERVIRDSDDASRENKRIMRGLKY